MEEGLQLKTDLLAYARKEVEASMASTRQSLTRLSDSLANETKSSAGDKFETGRAMLHMEQQKMQQQLAVSEERLEAVERISGKTPTAIVTEGSLVATNRGLYMVGLGLGKVRLQGRVVFCTSLDSPIGSQLIGKEVGEMFVFNGLEFLVKGMV